MPGEIVKRANTILQSIDEHVPVTVQKGLQAKAQTSYANSMTMSLEEMMGEKV